MYSTCLFCTKDLGANDVVETLPIGRRLAFDAAQGRLWVVCRHCAKWNLVPFDTRLESIDVCERLFRDTRTRFSTDNIGLAKVKEGLELVRIGVAQRPEFASWRYGEQYRRRRRNTLLMGGAGVALGLGAIAALNATGLAVAGGGYMSYQLLKGGWEAAVNRHSRVRLAEPSSGVPVVLDRKRLLHTAISWEDQTPSLDLHAEKKGLSETLSFQGTELRSVGRRITGSLNVLLGKAEDLREGTDILAHHSGDLTQYLRDRTEVQCRSSGPNASWRYPGPQAPDAMRRYMRPYLLLEKLGPADRLAIELWMNEDIERTWLEGELTLLEREWRQAEELAKISDALAVPETVNDELARRQGAG